MDEMTIEKAVVTDAALILGLVNELAQQQIMLPRAPASVIENIRDFVIARVDGRFAGCGALHVVWSDLAEIRSIAVDPSLRQHSIVSSSNITMNMLVPAPLSPGGTI